LLYSPKLTMWYVEAFQEIGVKKSIEDIDRRYAIYPKRFYKSVQQFNQNKEFDFCFIGALQIDEATIKRRSWILPFIEENFNHQSYLQFTDRKTKGNYQIKGDYDFTLKRSGFVPKEVKPELRNFFDEHYFRILCSSQFTLCPGGDQNWSMRFYEALMCKSIPILLDKTCFRTEYEAKLPYKYFVVGEHFQYFPDWAQHNYELFLRHHTLENHELIA